MSKKTSKFNFKKQHVRNSYKEMIKRSKPKTFGYLFVPNKNEILAKVSHVNEAMLDLKSEVYEHEKQQECHFLRILRIGFGVKDEKSLCPGKLVIVQKSRGHYLEQVSRKYGEDYWLIKEDDILAVVDL